MRSGVVGFALLAGCAGSGHAPVAPEPDARGEDTAITIDSASVDSAPAEASSDAAETGPSERRVLFIGNSYTYVNDLPAVLAKLSEASTPRLVTQSVTVGGATLENHWTTGTATARIDEKGWYAVVLQGQSVEPILPGSTFATYAQKLADRATAAGAWPVFYGTWARAAGDPLYAETWSGGTPDAMQDELTAAYGAAATAGKAGIAKVGEAFRISLKERPAVVLHQTDGSHPTVAATWLAACVFYGVLAGKPVPTTAIVPSGVSADDATWLRGVAARVL